MNAVENYKKVIVKAMKQNKSYNRCLDYQIAALASALRILDLANEEIDGLSVTTVEQHTHDGKKLAAHPAFKIAKESQLSITLQLKVLGLTSADLTKEIEEDPLQDITTRLARKRQNPVVVQLYGSQE